jgi:hypothetical protein
VSFSTGEQALAALAALGHKLDERGTAPVSLLMCGGAALNISGLLTRLTADVDVLGAMHANGKLGEMPDWIYPLAAEVAEELGLERHWLNDAAASVTSMGLPSGILLRATRHDFGKRLQVAIISRLDLIALKCFAALNPGVGEKHLGDLVDLHPLSEEMSFACGWLLNRPTSPEFRAAVRQLCDVLGHSDLAK